MESHSIVKKLRTQRHQQRHVALEEPIHCENNLIIFLRPTDFGDSAVSWVNAFAGISKVCVVFGLFTIPSSSLVCGQLTYGLFGNPWLMSIAWSIYQTLVREQLYHDLDFRTFEFT
jgi:hypothetical protein